MATATLPTFWEGRSGRRYVPAEGARVRHGGLALVRKVIGRGQPTGTSTVDEGVPLALKMWHEGDESSLDQLQAEARILVELSSATGELPNPRLYDLVGNPLVTGLVMEWCPADLERWWREKLTERDAFGRLMAALAEATRRVADYHDYFMRSRGMVVAHGDLKPTNLLLSMDGRWLVSDFGAARMRPVQDHAWESTRAVVGTENFISPESLFQAHTAYPAATDTWSMAATTFALLRLQRMILDGGPVPRNGTHSPRFRMARMNQVIEVYGRDPTRFHDRELDAGAFPDPLSLPDEDRRSIRECVRGAFGSDSPAREDKLADELAEVIERAMSIDPAHRYTSARDLAAAFDNLTRSYIALMADTDVVEPADEPVSHELLQERDDALRRVRTLQQQVESSQRQVADLQARLDYDEVPTRVQARDPSPAARLPRWWGVTLVLILLLQLVTALLTVIAAVAPFLQGLASP